MRCGRCWNSLASAPPVVSRSRGFGMGILLAFAPFIVFAVVDRMFGGIAGLVAGAAVSAVLVLRDWSGASRAPKLLEIGTVFLFAALSLYAVLCDPTWSIIGVRLRVDV